MSIIPDKIVLGTRTNIVSKKAYLTFNKQDGSIKNEVRFKKWLGQNSNIEIIENNPLNRFEVIQTIGGYSGCQRQAYVEIKDPRGFLIEITDENFIEICKNFGVSKGVLDGNYIYAFDETYGSLYLINENDSKYQEFKNNSIEYYKPKEKQPTFSFKDLKPGEIYNVKYMYENTLAMYLGKFSLYDNVPSNNSYGVEIKYKGVKRKSKSHVFLLNRGSSYKGNDVVVLRNSNILNKCKDCPQDINANEFQQILDDVQIKCDEYTKYNSFVSLDKFIKYYLDNSHPIKQLKQNKNLFKQ